MSTMHKSGPARPMTAVVVKQERLRFRNFTLSRTTSGRVACEVTLEYGDELIAGSQTGQSSPSGDTRLGADAALRALETFTSRDITFELIGVKVVRAFDAHVVIVSLHQHGHDGPERLLGCYLTDGDLVRGASLAVLNATNRTMSSYILNR